MDAEEVRAAFERAGADAVVPEPAADAVGAGAVPPFAGARRAGGPDDLEGAAAVVLGVPLGGADPAYAEGPAAIRRQSIAVVRPDAAGVLAAADYGDIAVDPGDLHGTFLRAHERLADVLAVGAVPVVLGGDHSVTIPVVQVLAGKLAGKLGIVAFDGCLDLRIAPRYEGRAQWARALELGVVDPANLVVVGVREGGATTRGRRVAEELGLRSLTTIDVDEMGILAVAQEALELAGAGTEAVYLSLDATVVDPGGGGSAGDARGLGARELARALRMLAGGRVAGMDVCCLAPSRDTSGALARVVAAAVATVLDGIAAQAPS